MRFSNDRDTAVSSIMS